jgi:hypothetical protein
MYRPASSSRPAISPSPLLPGSRYRSGRWPDWLKMKNPAAPAVKREAGPADSAAGRRMAGHLGRRQPPGRPGETIAPSAHPQPVQSAKIGQSNHGHGGSAGAPPRRRTDHHAEPVMFDFVDPARAGRRAMSGRRKAGIDKRNHTGLGSPADTLKPHLALAPGNAAIAASRVGSFPCAVRRILPL